MTNKLKDLPTWILYLIIIAVSSFFGGLDKKKVKKIKTPKKNEGVFIYIIQGIGIGLLSVSLSKYIFVDLLKDATINVLFFSVIITGFGMLFISLYFLNKRGLIQLRPNNRIKEKRK